MEKEYKIGDLILIKNEFRYYDIAIVLDILKSSKYNGVVYEISSLGFDENSRMIKEESIIGYIDLKEGFDIYDYINKQKRK